VDPEDLGTTVRYRLLETIREYAAERLADADGTTALRDHHLEYFTDLSEALALEFTGPNGTEVIRQLQREVDNLRAALLWAIDRSDADHALRLVCAIAVADWIVFNPFEHDSLAVGEIPGVAEHPRYPEYLARSAGALLRAGDIPGAVVMSDRALAAAREQSVDHWVIHNSLGLTRWYTGRIPEAIAHLENGVALTTDDATRAFMLQPLAAVHVAGSDDVVARQVAEESLAAAQRSGNAHLIAGAYIQIAYATVREDPDRATDAYVRVLDLVGDDDRNQMVHYARATLAELSSRRGDRDAFERYATAAVTAVARNAEWMQLGAVLAQCAIAFAQFDEVEAAAEAFESALRCGSSPATPEMRGLEVILAAHKDDVDVSAARVRGASRDPEEMAPWALETIARMRSR